MDEKLAIRQIRLISAAYRHIDKATLLASKVRTASCDFTKLCNRLRVYAVHLYRN